MVRIALPLDFSRCFWYNLRSISQKKRLGTTMAKESVVRNNIWKWMVLAIIAVVSIYVTSPVKDKLRFGLDLKGGTSFTLGVDTDKLAESIIAAASLSTSSEGFGTGT